MEDKSPMEPREPHFTPNTDTLYDPPPARRRPSPRLSPGWIGGIGAAAALIVVGAAPRFARHQKLDAEAHTATTAEPLVAVVHPTVAPGATETRLPGSVQALDKTTINARSNGYVSKYYVDIGARVHAGQILADIESPDVDQQALAARADARKSQAMVGQSQAEAARMQAGVAQARATQVSDDALVSLSRADVTRYQAKRLQANAAVASAQSALARAGETLAGKKADLARAQVAAKIAGTTLGRWKQLGAVNAVSGEEVDEKQADFDTATVNVTGAQAAVEAAGDDIDAARNNVAAARGDAAAATSDVEAARQKVAAAQATVTSGAAGVDAAQASVNAGREDIVAAQAATQSSLANVQRYAALQGFQKIVAPFSGVITARNIDVGSLVGGASSGGSEAADPSRTVSRAGLFGIARTDALRVEVDVPEELVGDVHVGQTAQVTLRDFPGRVFSGKVLTVGGALDATSRTEQIEVRVANPTGALLPGMDAQVAFVGARSRSVLTIPANALLTDSSGTRVAEVTPDGKVHFQDVQVGRDMGSTVEIASGLKGDESLIADPSDDLTEGESVQAKAAGDSSSGSAGQKSATRRAAHFAPGAHA